ncbi:hypothetical protein ANN_00739 [Periplaneta americana]|uniref:Reverse transcriptase n=1 Tax=Periplaneta americana TaxID=6978 RepID=A0ABQ8TU20_PERAM|nr:hypothetical protein ANN_00739 [Periplaneta americana]
MVIGAAEENNLHINEEKTVQMTLRKGGKSTLKHNITLHRKPLQKVGNYKYLGITLQTTAASFGLHIQERAAAAIRAAYNIPNLANLSTCMAKKLFKTVAPVITYGIEIM